MFRVFFLPYFILFWDISQRLVSVSLPSFLYYYSFIVCHLVLGFHFIVVIPPLWWIGKKICESAPVWNITAGAKDPYYWVNIEVQKARSRINLDRAFSKLLGDIRIARSRDDEEFEYLPYASEERVCDSRDMKDIKFIYVYKTLFKDLRVRLPFTKFECGVLVQMNVAPIQLHPNN